MERASSGLRSERLQHILLGEIRSILTDEVVVGAVCGMADAHVSMGVAVARDAPSSREVPHNHVTEEQWDGDTLLIHRKGGGRRADRRAGARPGFDGDGDPRQPTEPAHAVSPRGQPPSGACSLLLP